MESQNIDKQTKCMTLLKKLPIIYLTISAVWLFVLHVMIQTFLRHSPYALLIEVVLEFLHVVFMTWLGHLIIKQSIRALTHKNQIVQQNEEQLRTLIDAVPDVVYFKDGEGRWLEVNQAGIRLFDLEQDTYKGKSDAELYTRSPYSQSFANYTESDEQAWQQGTIIHVEHTIDTPSGRKIFDVTKVPIFEADGSRKGLVVVASDMTEKKLAEEELKTTKEQLESFIQNNADAIYLVDLDNRITNVNASFEQILGWTVAEVIGKEMPLVLDEEIVQEEKLLNEMIKEGGYVMGYETSRYRKDGTQMTVSLTLSPIHNGKGELVAVSGIIRDITEQRRTEELLRNSDKLSVLGQLAAGIAHEIRNPLTALRGFIQLIQMQSNGENERYCKIMISELDRINFIVSELLVLAKPQMTNYQKRDVRVLLQTVITLLETQAIMNNVNIVLDVEHEGDEFPAITCEENQIKQVFINILKNGIESMPDGGEIRIMVSRKGDDQLLIRCVDQGCGITDERLKKLGEPFYTTKEKGTGLGLMVSYRIIQNHMGKIYIDSKLSVGTTVDITFPITE